MTSQDREIGPYRPQRERPYRGARVQEHEGRMARIWAYGMAAFGSRWVSAYGEAGGPSFKVWCYEMRQWADEPNLVEAGRRALLSWSDSFPPSLQQFRAQFRVELHALQANLAAMDRAQKLIGWEEEAKQPRRLSEVAKREIAKIRAMLGRPETADEKEDENAQ